MAHAMVTMAAMEDAIAPAVVAEVAAVASLLLPQEAELPSLSLPQEVAVNPFLLQAVVASSLLAGNLICLSTQFVL